MAVYTEVSDEDLAAFAKNYDFGEILSAKGIAEGVENSNYLLQTAKGPYILTLYERRVEPKQLPFFLGLMEHLARSNVQCPVPLKGRDGEALRTLCGRPAAVISFLSGLWPRRVTAEHCAELGAALAGLHQAGMSYEGKRANSLSVDGWLFLLSRIAPQDAENIERGLNDLLTEELFAISKAWPKAGLPTGIIHADLFPDNVFFQHGKCSGLIDFYFACNDLLAYDIAICLNAWCFESDGSFNITKAKRLFAAYQAVRPLEPAEKAALPILARGAAMRFLLTRLFDWVNTPAGAMVKPKDPREYLLKLNFHRRVSDLGAYGLS